MHHEPLALKAKMTDYSYRDIQEWQSRRQQRYVLQERSRLTEATFKEWLYIDVLGSAFIGILVGLVHL